MAGNIQPVLQRTVCTRSLDLEASLDQKDPSLRAVRVACQRQKMFWKGPERRPALSGLWPGASLQAPRTRDMGLS